MLVVAVLALHDPQHHGKAAGGTQKIVAAPSTSTPVSPRPSGSPAPSRHPSRSASHSVPPRTATSSAASLVGALPLVVLNDTTTTGLAANAARRFENGGWTVTSYSNLTNDILSTCAYFDPSVPDARAVATALQRQYPTIKRVQPKFDGLPPGPVVVVLTPDYSPGP